MSFKKCQVVMLPTNEKANIGANNWYLRNTQKLIINNLVSHLYITSDDGIKDGDWFYDFLYGVKQYSGKIKPASYSKKIIATTDSSLGLSQPSQEFIDKYIQEYNKGNIITDVLVEYDFKVYELNPIRLKINKDNTITIRKVKDSWDRDEVISLFNKYTTAYEEFGIMFNKDKFIEENL